MDTELNISKKSMRAIFDALKSSESPFGKFQEDGYLGLIGEVWDLDNMSSQDSRYETASQDIYQHTVMNDDWDDEYLFLERLDLFSDQNIFMKFIETAVSPNYRNDEADIHNVVDIINGVLETEGYSLAASSYNDDGLPIYKFQLDSEREGLPTSIPPSRIKFKVIKNPSGRSDKFASHKPPTEFPCFILVHNYGWNDYDFKTVFNLFYYQSKDNRKHIGSLKIGHIDNIDTSNVIPDEFQNLSSDFFSLGMQDEYYQNLKTIFNKEHLSILYSLQDCAFFPDILEQHENTSVFVNSLIRYDVSERLLREAKYKINGYDLQNLYSFQYSFKPKYSEDLIKVDFSFNNDGNIPNRVYAIIGKNGSGKTQLVSSLPISLAEEDETVFEHRLPIFSKVIAVSFSLFDNFKIPKKTATFNYVYCGLKRDTDDAYTERGRISRFHYSWKKIKNQSRTVQWRAILLTVIDENIVNEFIVLDEETSGQSYKVHLDGFKNVRNKLSSGQAIFLFILTEIVANIRYDSLLIYDEPETHLHPNAITQLMNAIYNLVNEFQSYCIIATHSPLIIRELFSKNVYILERHEQVPSIRKIGIESFGENLSILTEEVFGNKEVPKHYKALVDSLKNRGFDFNGIVEELESNNMPISLNTRLYIQSIMA